MRKYLFFLILTMGCSSDYPENLISEEKMESIIFDIMILNASYNYDLIIDNNLLSDGLLKRTENFTESLSAEVKYIKYVIYSKLGEIDKANFNLKEAYSLNPAIYDYFRDIFPTIPQLHVFKNMNAS